MTDSTDNKLTYNRILERAKQDALEAMPEFPKLPDQTDFTLPEDHAQHCYEAWEAYQQEVEDIDAYEVANESSEWDWVIYYHRALELCQAVPSDVLHEAERVLLDDFGHTEIEGLYELAGQLANLIVVRAIADAVEEVKEELIDLAQTNMENY